MSNISRQQHSHNNLLILLLLFLVMSISDAEIQAAKKCHSVSAILVFGDSTVDPGNNNYIDTFFKSNFQPYGQTMKNQLPTGRFTNGKLSTDYIASHMGLKEYVPPYLNPTLSMDELMTGVSFASAGTGYDPLTSQISSVISMTKQLDYFKEYKTRMEKAIGKQRAQNMIKKAMFVVSAGTNDFVVNFFTVPIRRHTFTVSSYQHFLIQHVRTFIQALFDYGARKILIIGLPPMGCLPVVITINSENAFLLRNCIESYSSVAIEYNKMLENELKMMNMTLGYQGAKIAYVDIYSPLNEMVQSGHKFGFDVVSNGCCGSGLVEAGFLCNPQSVVCSDVSKYVFWDSIHPTEKAYYMLFKEAQLAIDHLMMIY